MQHTINNDDAILNDLLGRWHRWACDYRTAVGYPTAAAYLAQYRTSRQYDDVNGALDGDVENCIMSGVDGCLNSVPQPYRNALHLNARNLVTGLTVWRSPRLPDDDMARAQLVAEARAMLLKRLRVREMV